MASESVVRVQQERFEEACSRLRTLEALADVAMVQPEGLTVGTAEICRDSVYFGILEVRQLLLDSVILDSMIKEADHG